MKLATYKDGSRDGQLVVVSRDLAMAHYATGIAQTLQQALDDWNFLAPQLQDLYHTLQQGKARHAFPFDARLCKAPLPRPASVVVAEWPERHLVACGADTLCGPHDDLRLPPGEWGIDMGAGVAVVTADVPMGAEPTRAIDAVRLMGLTAEVVLRACLPDEQADTRLSARARPAVACSPVVVTPDEWGEAWSQARLHLTLQSSWNGRALGRFDLGDMPGSFGDLIAELASTRPLPPGTVVGSGIQRHPAQEAARAEWPKGHGCLAHRRAAEMALHGEALTPYLQVGDAFRVDLRGRDGLSVCGAIERSIQWA